MNYRFTVLLIIIIIGYFSSATAFHSTEPEREKIVGDCYTLYANIDVDYNYYSAHGSDKASIETSIRQVMKEASAMYESVFAIRFVINTIKIYDTPDNDPYFGIVDVTSNAFFTKMKDIHDTHSSNSIYDFYILFTNNTFEDLSGAAYQIGGMYIKDAAYCLTNVLSMTVIAHEIGHLLGASHCDAECVGAESYGDANCKAVYYQRNTLMCHAGSGNTFGMTELQVFSSNIISHFTPGVVKLKSINSNSSLVSQSFGILLDVSNSMATASSADIVLSSGYEVRFFPTSKFMIDPSSSHAIKLMIDGTINECEDVGTIVQARKAQPVNEQEIEPQNQLLRLIPNPSTGSATLAYWLADDSHVSISTFDLLGKKTNDVLLNASLTKGSHTTAIDMTGYPKGVYMIRIIKNEKSEMVKMLIN